MDKRKKNGLSETVRRYGKGRKSFFYTTLLFSAIYGLSSILPYYFIWKIINALVRGAISQSLDTSLIVHYALWIVASQLIGLIVYFIALASSHILAFRVEKNIRKEAMAYVLELSLGFFQNHDSGVLRRLVDDNASKTHGLIAHVLPDVTGAMVVPVCLVVVLFLVDWRFGLLCVSGVAIAFFNMATLLQGSARLMMDKYAQASESLSANGVEYIRGIPVVKVFNQTVESFKRFHDSILDYDKHAKNFVNFCRPAMSRYTVSLYAPVLLLPLLCIFLMPGSVQPVELFVKCLFYVMIAILFYTSLMRTMAINEQLNVFNVTLARLDTIFSQNKMIVKEEQKKKEEGIVFENVSFTYPSKDEVALKDINLHFEKGKSYALVGKSGSGKTTLVHLIARFYDITQGSLRMDGKELRNIENDELLKELSIVFQMNKLMKNTLRENITMGGDFSEEEIKDALEKAGGQDILERMEQGLDTMLGTKGTYLSGGEIQRVALARAFLRKSKVLLLDEATAYADPENEEVIQQSIKKLREEEKQRESVIIMIAHRLNTVKDADQIILMDEGRILEQGSHKELMERCETYRKMYEEFTRSIEWRVKHA